MDIICCIAILVPIIWSIRHLKEASAIDGKAAKNLEKLRMFRQFYLMVVSYIYFTRIIVYLLDATLPFRWTWFGVFASELATLIFYFATGYVLSLSLYLSLSFSLSLSLSLSLSFSLSLSLSLYLSPVSVLRYYIGTTSFHNTHV